MAEQDVFADFIRRVRAGDECAAEELVSKFEPIVRRELRLTMTDRKLRSSIDSVDICQSIWSSFFLRTAAGQYDLDTPAHLIRLLMSMAKNKLASQARRMNRQKRDVGRTETPGRSIEVVSDRLQDTPSAIVSGRELLALMETQLSAEERQVVGLRREGLTWEEVALRMGGTAQARRMQMDRAADRVAQQIGIVE